MSNNAANHDFIEELTHCLIYPLWNDRDISVIDRYIAKQAEIRTTFVTGEGPAVLRKSIEETFAAFPVFKLKLQVCPRLSIAL